MQSVAVFAGVAGAHHRGARNDTQTNRIFDIDIVNGSAYNPRSRQGADFVVIDARWKFTNDGDVTQYPLS